MRISIVAFILAALYGAAFSMPPDPEGISVIDRALYRGTTPGEDHVLYITLFNTSDSIGTVELQSGIRLQDGWYWETVCIWNPMTYNGNPLCIEPGSVLSIQRHNSSLYLTWIDRLDYIEGMASLYLDYNLQSREFEEFYMD